MKDPHFWLKKWTQKGLRLTQSDKAEWIRIFDLAENTKQEEDVLKFIKRVIQRGHLVSVRCFITENDLKKFLNLRKIRGEVILAMGNEELGIVQLLAPVLVKSPNTLKYLTKMDILQLPELSTEVSIRWIWSKFWRH